MSDKQLEDLLAGFVNSSQSLSTLQEGILTLHSVMEQFQTVTKDFAVKNEFEILLPTVKKHFAQANDVYTSITEHLQKIQVQTEDMVPAYQKLQVEVAQLKDMQAGMISTFGEISDSVQEMSAMQKQIGLQMIEYRQMMTESRQMQVELLAIAQENLAMNTFIQKLKGALSLE